MSTHPVNKYSKLIPIELIYSEKLSNESNEDFEIRVKAMMEYISNGGCVEPLEVYKQGNYYIVGDGRHRYEAMKRLGWKEIYCRGFF